MCINGDEFVFGNTHLPSGEDQASVVKRSTALKQILSDPELKKPNQGYFLIGDFNFRSQCTYAQFQSNYDLVENPDSSKFHLEILPQIDEFALAH